MKNTIFGMIAVSALVAVGSFSGCGSTDESNAAPAAGNASATPSAMYPGTGALTVVAGNTGQYLGDSSGRSLYSFAGDTTGQSNCNGECATVWPPLLVASGQAPAASNGINSALLGTLTRADGTIQVTYNGAPLYYYSGDQNMGDTQGEGLTSYGALWWLVQLNGSPLMPSTSTTVIPVPIYGSTTCLANGQCCDQNWRCFGKEYNCDSSGHCCDRNGNCYNGHSYCDESWRCCDQNNSCYNHGIPVRNGGGNPGGNGGWNPGHNGGGNPGGGGNGNPGGNSGGHVPPSGSSGVHAIGR